MRRFTALALLLALTACGGNDDPPSADAPPTTIGGAPTCADLAPGQAIPYDIAATGCVLSDGSVYVNSITCADGRVLFQVDRDGPPRWGYAGEEMRDGSPVLARDPAYSQAFNAC